MYDVLKFWWLQVSSMIPALTSGLAWNAGWMVFNPDTFPDDLDLDFNPSTVVIPRDPDEDFEAFKERFGILEPRDPDAEWRIDAIVASDESITRYLLLSLVRCDIPRADREACISRFIKIIDRKDVFFANDFIHREQIRISKKFRERVMSSFDRHISPDHRD